MKALFLSILSLTSLFLSAGEPDYEFARASFLSTEIDLADDNQLAFKFNNPLGKEIEIKLRNESGIVVYHKDFDTDLQYNGLFDLESLPKANYSFEVYMDDVLVERRSVNHNFAFESTTDQLIQSRLSQLDDDNTLQIEVNNPLGQGIELEVKNNRGQIVHRESFDTNKKVKQLLRTDLLAPGTYTFELWSGAERAWHMTVVQDK